MKPLTIGCAVFLLLFAGGTRVEAQGVASSFDQLGVLVKPGDKISVVDVAGREVEGRIGILSRDALILSTAAGMRELGEADVAKIRQRRDDSLKNGAIIGAVAGTSYGLAGLALATMTSDGGDVNKVGATTAVLLCTGIGAAIGVGIDALITRRQVIYQKPASGSSVGVSPLFGHGRRGVAVSVQF